MQYLRPIPLFLSGLLSACVAVPAQQQSSAPATPLPPAPPVPAPADAAPAAADAATHSAPINDQATLWEQLRGSFAMADCNADPVILQAAQRYTQNPRHFEALLSAAAPKLAYVQSIAAKHGVAGEFVLLPWVESEYRPVLGSRSTSAGLWQIMPVTAQAMGLPVNRNFDGRMDVAMATDAIMVLLNRYYQEFGDWRMVDYAFNAGQFAIRRTIARYGKPAASPVIPRLPVKHVTHEHLVRLLALACIIRTPARFHINLPSVSPDQRLVRVSVNTSMPIRHAASRAGMATADLQELNAGFLNGIVDTHATAYLLMPNGRAQQFRNTLTADNDDSAPDAATSSSLTSFIDDTDNPSAPAPAPTPPPPPAMARDKTHIVKAGETLWGIAHSYAINVNQLKQWNHLQNTWVKPGQQLEVSSPTR